MTDAAYAVRPEIAARTNLTEAQHKAWSEQAQADPQAFWLAQSKRLDWTTAPTIAQRGGFDGDARVTWYEDGALNVAANCLDRHLAERGDQVAIIWEGDDPGQTRSVTYRALHELVCRAANAMTALGVAKGDRVTIYLPMVIEAAVAMLACARIGAIHAVVFGGFSPDSLANRIQDCDSTVLITADEGRRGGRKVALKANADVALANCPTIRHVLVVTVTGGERVDAARPRPPLGSAARRRLARLPGPAHGGGRPAVHPLHLRQHRQAEGRPAYQRRIPGLGQLHPPLRVRLPAGGDLLVHRRRRLGHRTHLHRLRPARERRHHADVRGRPELPRQRPLLGGGRQARGQHLLHRPHRHPRPDARGRGPGEALEALQPARARQRRRTHQPPRPGPGTTA